MSKVYYQPNLTDKEWDEHRWFNSFDVYHSFDNAKKDFPNSEIGAYSGDDIENPNFVDEIPCPECGYVEDMIAVHYEECILLKNN